MIAPCRFERAFDRLRTGIAEENDIGETVLRQTAREILLSRDTEDVGNMPELPRLFVQCRDKRGMSMAQTVRCNARDTVQKCPAVPAVQPHAFAPVDLNVGAIVDSHKVTGHSLYSLVF